MAITNPVGARDVVFIQRDNINSAYGEIHVSGTLLIPYIDATGNITVADSGSFFTLFPPSGSSGGGSGISIVTASLVPITSSWAESASFAVSAISASWAPGSTPGTTTVTSSLVPITSSWATTASFTINSVAAVSASWATASYTASHVLGNVFGDVTGSVFGTSSQAVSASWAPIPDSVASSSWASASYTASFLTLGTYPITASQAISASWAPVVPSDTAISASWASASYTASLINVLFTASNANYYVPFVSNTGSQQVYIDSASIYYNPGNDTLTVHYISASGVTASLTGTASWAESASYVDSTAFANLFLPLEFTYKNSTAAGDPGNGNFRYNSLISSSITNIYIDTTTANGLDVSKIFLRMSSGSNQIYVQQKTDATRASLFAMSSEPVDNGGWFTLPVLYLTSSVVGLPSNNANCAFILYNNGIASPTIDLSAYLSSSWTGSSTSQFSGTASFSVKSNVATSASWASSSYTASFLTLGTYPITASQSISASWSPSGVSGTTTVTASLVPITASWAVSASWAPGGSGVSASWSETSSYVPIGRSIVLCSAYTPTAVGVDAAEVPVPFSPIDGSSSINWNVKRLSIRAQTSETLSSSVIIEKSITTGFFSSTVIGTVTLLSGAYENATTGSLGTVYSGNKIRFNVDALGTAINWTVVTELSNA